MVMLWFVVYGHCYGDWPLTCLLVMVIVMVVGYGYWLLFMILVFVVCGLVIGCLQLLFIVSVCLLVSGRVCCLWFGCFLFVVAVAVFLNCLASRSNHSAAKNI